MTIKAIIIDDEANNRENLQICLESYCPNVNVVAQANSAMSGIDAIKTHQPDLVFLDIEMPMGNGFEMLESLGDFNFEIIFVTAYDQYAIRAIKFCALDYLLKPIKVLELKTAVEKVAQKLSSQEENQQLRLFLQNMKQQIKRIALPTAEKIEYVPITEIVHCRGENNYTRIFLTNNTQILVSRTLKEYEEILSDMEFLRVHQSHLINLNHVKSFVRADGGYIVMSDQSTISISRNRRERVFRQLNGE